MALLFTKLRRSPFCRLPGILAFVLFGTIVFALTTIQRQGKPGDVLIEVEEDIAKQRRRVSLTNPVERTTIMDLSHWTCSKQLTLLTPSMGPFKAWREYKLLQESFRTPANGGVPQFQLTCPRYKCNLTVGVTLSDKDFLGKSDGVVINIAPNLLKNKLAATAEKLSPILREDVSWFFLGMESPQMFTFWDPDIANILYHNAIAYHSLSTLPVPYGYYVASDPMDSKPREDLLSKKTRLIAWMASNCENTFWPRNDFVHDLAKFLPIDMYGKCGNLTCLPPMSEECNNMLQSYKFYLALENTECDEYITEKFWDNCLKHGVVPVVYGGRKAAYEKLAPPNSFIHVSDFKSTEELANYLIELSKDDIKYSKYFQWRQYGHVKTNYPPFSPEIFCDTIPLTDPKSRENGKQAVSESKYFNTCRAKPNGRFVEAGSYGNWSPWK